MLLSPQGEMFTQAVAQELSGRERVVLICGRYEGVDERVSEHLADREISVGDFVLSGGELGGGDNRGHGNATGSGSAGQRGVVAAGVVRGWCSADRRERKVSRRVDLRLGRIAGLSALHASGGVSRDAGSRGAGEREPRRDSPLAPSQRAAEDVAQPAGLIADSGI